MLNNCVVSHCVPQASWTTSLIKQQKDGLPHRVQHGFARYAQDSHCWYVRRRSHCGAPALDTHPQWAGVRELPVVSGPSERLWQLRHPGDGFMLWPNWACCVCRWLHGAAHCLHVRGTGVQRKWHVVNVPTQSVWSLQPGTGEIASDFFTTTFREFIPHQVIK